MRAYIKINPPDFVYRARLLNPRMHFALRHIELKSRNIFTPSFAELWIFGGDVDDSEICGKLLETEIYDYCPPFNREKEKKMCE